MKEKKIQGEITASFIIIIISGFFYLLFGSHTIYEFPSSQDIPLIQRVLDPDFLTTDFYTNSIVFSPRYFFIAPIILFSKLGFNWENIFYLFRLIYLLTYKAIYFFAFTRILSHFMHNKWTETLKQKSIFVLMFIFLFDIIGFIFSKFGTPAGWISLTSIDLYIPMAISSIFGIFFLLLELKNFRVYSQISLFLMTIIHPTMGIGFFSYWSLALIFINRTRKNVLNILLKGILSITIPCLLLMLNYKGESLNATEFVYHYVFIRHPHHYSINYIFGVPTIAIGILFLVSAILLRKNSSFFKWAIYGIITYFIPIFLQFIAVDVLKIKLLAMIGPSRFTSLSPLILLFILYLVYFEYKDKVKDKVKVKVKYFSVLYNLYVKIKLPNKKIITTIVVCYIFIAFKVTLKHPLAQYKEGSMQNVVQWIKKNTSKDSVFYLYQVNSILFRSYAQRAVFADYAFPFNESHFKEFSRRFLILKKSHYLNEQHYQCLGKYFNVDYLLTSSSIGKRLKEIEVLYTDKNWKLFKLKTKMNIQKCSPSDLFYKYEEFKHYII